MRFVPIASLLCFERLDIYICFFHYAEDCYALAQLTNHLVCKLRKLKDDEGNNPAGDDEHRSDDQGDLQAGSARV